MSEILKTKQTEDDIPHLAEQAIRQAVADALAAGKSVLVTHGDVIYEVFADGTKQTFAHLLPSLLVEPGKVRFLPQC